MKAMENDKKYLQPYNVTMSKHSLSAMELRILVSIMYALKEQQLKKYEVRDLFETKRCLDIEIDKSDLVKGTNYHAVLQALRSIRARTLHIKEGKRDIICGLVNKTNSEEHDDRVIITLEETVLPQLIELSNNYTKAGIEFTFQTQNKYAIRWYQLGCHWLNKGYFEMKVQDIRLTFKIAEKSYPVTKDFNNRIIKEPLKEVNGKSDINIIATPVKKGRTIVSWQFKVRKQEPPKINEKPEKKQPKKQSKLKGTQISLLEAMEKHKETFFDKRLHALVEETKYEQGAWKSVCYHFSTECEFDYYFKEMTKKLDLDKIKTIFAFKNRLSSYMTACIFNDIKAPKEKILARFNQEIKKY